MLITICLRICFPKINLEKIQVLSRGFLLYANVHVTLFLYNYHADMKIVQAFPCRCRFADKENAPKVEEEVNFLHVEMFCWHKNYRQSRVFYASLYVQCSLKEKEQCEL